MQRGPPGSEANAEENRAKQRATCADNTGRHLGPLSLTLVLFLDGTVVGAEEFAFWLKLIRGFMFCRLSSKKD